MAETLHTASDQLAASEGDVRRTEHMLAFLGRHGGGAAALQEVASGFAAAGEDRRRAARNLAFLSRCADAGILSKGVICMGCQSGLKGRQQGW